MSSEGQQSSHLAHSLLVPGRFDGQNYLGWSRLVLLVLGGRDGYLQHIDGSASVPKLPTKPSSAISLEANEAQAQKEAIADYDSKVKKLGEWERIDCQIDAMRPPPPIEGAAGLIMREAMESDRLQKFLQGLGQTYSSLANQIIATQPLHTVDAAYRLVLAAETRLNTALVKDSSEDTASVFAANHRIPQQRNPGNQQGSVTSFSNNKSKLKCSYCHKTGHLRDRCYKLHGRANILAKDSAARGNFATVENTPFENRSTGVSSPEIGASHFSPDFNQFVKTLYEAYQTQLPSSNNDGNLITEEHTIGPTKLGGGG